MAFPKPTGPFADEIVGDYWPQGNEDQLRADGQALIADGKRRQEDSQELKSGSRGFAEVFSGPRLNADQKVEEHARQLAAIGDARQQRGEARMKLADLHTDAKDRIDRTVRTAQTQLNALQATTRGSSSSNTQAAAENIKNTARDTVQGINNELTSNIAKYKESFGPEPDPDPGPSLPPAQPPACRNKVDKDLLKAVFKDISDDDAEKFAASINKAAQEFNIDKNANRLAAWLAQMRGEVGSTLADWFEGAPGRVVEQGPDAVRQYFDNMYNSNPYQHNIPGSDDGYNFRGHGPCQITGRHNFTAAQNFFNLQPSLLDSPDQLADVKNPDLAFRAAAWFFTDADGADPNESLHHVNPDGTSGPNPQNVNGNILADGISSPDDSAAIDAITDGTEAPQKYNPDGSLSETYQTRRDAYRIALEELLKRKCPGAGDSQPPSTGEPSPTPPSEQPPTPSPTPSTPEQPPPVDPSLHTKPAGM